jgi:hypothetical protein
LGGGGITETRDARDKVFPLRCAEHDFTVPCIDADNNQSRRWQSLSNSSKKKSRDFMN